jgi:hypothetical protein
MSLGFVRKGGASRVPAFSSEVSRIDKSVFLPKRVDNLSPKNDFKYPDPAIASVMKKMSRSLSVGSGEPTRSSSVQKPKPVETLASSVDTPSINTIQPPLTLDNASSGSSPSSAVLSTPESAPASSEMVWGKINGDLEVVHDLSDFKERGKVDEILPSGEYCFVFPMRQVVLGDSVFCLMPLRRVDEVTAKVTYAWGIVFKEEGGVRTRVVSRFR